jgi:spore maturation protein CgeB
MNIVILGLSITSSWGNGHATTYRSLVKGLHKRGHKVLFLERDVPWYASNRDMAAPDFCKVGLYHSLEDLKTGYYSEVEKADLVITGSYVPEGIAAGQWVLETASGIKAFYDIDTPVTLTKLRNNTCDYLSAAQIPSYNLYLSFTAGKTLDIFRNEFGSPDPRAFYCSVDPEVYFPVESEKKWDLGYLGTYSDDRQPALNELLIEPARSWHEGRFIVAGPQYPKSINWPDNVERIEHLAPGMHNLFYNSQKFTLNITRKDMVNMGHSPSVRLFEAAACGTPVISDYWKGIESIFEPGKEILISTSAEDTLGLLRDISEKKGREIGENARKNVLKNHTGIHRATELEKYVDEKLPHAGSAKMSNKAEA